MENFKDFLIVKFSVELIYFYRIQNLIQNWFFRGSCYVYLICLLWADYNLIDLFSITSFIIKSFLSSFCVLFFIGFFFHLVVITFFIFSKMIIIYARLFLWPIHFPKYCFTLLMMPVLIIVTFQSFVMFSL